MFARLKIIFALLATLSFLQIAPASAPSPACQCDEALSETCRATPWKPTGSAWCQWSGRCGLLPTRWQEYTRTVTCTYLCWNGCTFSIQWTEYDTDAIGCCGSWFPFSPVPSKEHPERNAPDGCSRQDAPLGEARLALW